MAQTLALEEMMNFHVLVYREGDVWLAHCLECDLVAQHENQEGALSGIQDSLGAMISYATEHGDLRPLYSPAPIELWEQYQAHAGNGGAVQLPPRLAGSRTGPATGNKSRRPASSPALQAVTV